MNIEPRSVNNGLGVHAYIIDKIFQNTTGRCVDRAVIKPLRNRPTVTDPSCQGF